MLNDEYATCECGHEWHVGACKDCDCAEARKDPDSGFDDLEYEMLGDEYLHPGDIA